MLRVSRKPPVAAKNPSPGGDSGIITARYNLNARRDPRTGARQFYACRVEVLSADAVTVSAPVTGDLGTPVLVKIDRFGELRGFIAKRTRTGFVIGIAATDSDRAKLRRKIEWFEKVRSKELTDRREHDRFAPEDPLSTMVLSDGTTMRCFVIDMSASGASISAKVVPPAGTPLAVGKVVGRVVRHIPNGFAIRFLAPVDVNALEALLIKPSLGSPDR